MPTYTKSVSIQWIGLDKLVRMMDPKVAKRGLDEGLTDTAIDVEHRAKDGAPRKTSTLSRSIRVYGRRTGNTRLIIAGSSKVPYAAAHEAGSGLHGPKRQKYPIRPRNKKMLFFPSQQALTARMGKRAKLRKTLGGRATNPTMKKYGNAAFVMTKLVMHPGVKGVRYMGKAIESTPMARFLAQALVRHWRRA